LLSLDIEPPVAIFFCNGVALFNSPEFTENLSIFTAIFVHSFPKPQDVSSVDTFYPQRVSIPLSLFCYVFFVIIPLFSAEVITIASKFTTFPDTILYRRHSFLQYASRPAQPPSNSQQLAKIGL